MDFLMILLFMVIIAFGFLVVSAVTGKSLRYKHDSEPFATPDVIPNLIKQITEVFVDKNSPNYKIKVLKAELKKLTEVDIIRNQKLYQEAEETARSNELMNKYSDKKGETDVRKILENKAFEKHQRITEIEREIEKLKRIKK